MSRSRCSSGKRRSCATRSPRVARVVKELGDGLLLWFDCADEAIDTCLQLQRAFDTDMEAEIPLWVRIGVHFGCPRRRGDDIIGHDVNLAARIVELAGPGRGVVLRGDGRRRPATCAGIVFEPLGPVFVRGIDDAVPIVRAIAES